MRVIAIGVLFLIAWAPDCWAYGSIARGYAGRSIRFVSVVNLSIKEDDESAAISACMKQGLTDCQVILSFRDRCVAVAISPTGPYTTALGESTQSARADASAACGLAQCKDALSACDKTPTAEPEPPPYDFDSGGVSRGFRLFHVFLVAIYGGTAIVVVLSLWLLATLLSTAQSHVLKRRAAIFFWVALPSLPICAGWAFIPYHPLLGGHWGSALLCWTLVFAALWIGSLIQSNRRNAPDVLSLPLAALLFSIITFGLFEAFIAYGIVSSPADCEEPMSLLSLCALSHFEGFYFSGAAIVVLIFVGIFLSEETPLVRLYTGLRHSVSTIMIKGAPLRKVFTALGPAILSLRGALIAVSYTAAIIGGVVLAVFLDPVRLWRESRIGVFEIAATGIVFILAIAILFLLRKVHGLQQLLTASPPVARIVVDDLKTGTTDRPANDRSQSTDAWDPGAIKETFKRKRHEFEM
jgi:Domain of unknown function (DUF4189)